MLIFRFFSRLSMQSNFANKIYVHSTNAVRIIFNIEKSIENMKAWMVNWFIGSVGSNIKKANSHVKPLKREKKL